MSPGVGQLSPYFQPRVVHFSSNISSGSVAREVDILLKVDHVNIVSLIDVFHNPTYYQLVMEQHGPGFDLYSFVSENAEVDENIASFIFRQV